jgi:hypothetical protein
MAFSRKSASLSLASRSQKLLREIFFPVCFMKFLYASAIDFFFVVTEKAVIKETTSSKREIFFHVEIDHFFPKSFLSDSILL